MRHGISPALYAWKSESEGTTVRQSAAEIKNNARSAVRIRV